MNRAKYILVFGYIAFAWQLAYAGSPIAVKQLMNQKVWNFVENNGQLISPEIKYYGHQGGVYLYCVAGKISFVFTKVEKENDGNICEATGTLSPAGGGRGWKCNSKPSKTTINRADLILLNSNPSAQIIASDQQGYYENYYTARDANNSITNVHTYKTVTYKSIYPHIDMILHCKEGGMKYEFVVYPGGRVSDIQLQWNGLEDIKKLRDAGIEYSLALGKMKESTPYSYQSINNNVGAGFTPAQSANIYNEKADGKGRPYMDNTENKIESHFVFSHNRIRFKIGKYDKTKTLVIDPTLIWGTYFGEGNDYGHGIATDKSGNIYCTGSTGNNSDIATNGAYQTSIGSNQDAYLAKFNSNGTIEWATYYGGKGIDYGWAVATDGIGNVYIIGSTKSDSGIATNGAYQTSNVSSTITGYNIGDVFLAKFSSNGTRLWATYYGGEGPDFGDGVATDSYGNVYITGGTQSKTGIATKGAFESSSKHSLFGYDDAFLAKFDGNGNIQWATYYSGNGDDDAQEVATDGYGNVYITGGTESTSGIATSGAYQTSYNKSGYDGFLAKFNGAGFLQWATYSGGIGYGVVTDGKGNVYITGGVSSSSGIATKGAYQTYFGGNEDAYLAKFDSLGAIQWATYYGGSGYDIGQNIAIDRSGSVYISGLTTSSSQIATGGAYQGSYEGTQDAFLSRFDNNGALKWATYYRGNKVCVGYGVAVDTSGSIYITGYSAPDDPNVLTSGEYQTFGNDQVAFLAKFNIPDADLNPDSFSCSFYPNPFYTTGTLKYDLYAKSNVSIVLYDAVGRNVAILEDNTQLAGQYSIDFNAAKFSLAPGTYFLVFKSEEGNKTLKIISL